MANQKLFTDFPPVDREAWIALIQKDLKGADFEKKLVWETAEGFKIQPVYTKEDIGDKQWLTSNLPGTFPFARSTRKLVSDWSIRQDLDSNSISEANQLAKEAASNGVTAIGFIIENKTSPQKGIPVNSSKDLETLIQGLPFDQVTLHFIAEERSPEIFSWLPKDKVLVGGLGYDPFRILLKHGRSGKHSIPVLKEILETFASSWPHYRGLSVYSSTFRDAGSTISEELAFTLAAAAEYVQQLKTAGMDVDTIASQLMFEFSIGPDYFLEIAKFRSARILWAEILKEFFPKVESSLHAFLSAHTCRYNYSAYDPNVNMLRATTEAMSAAIGGCEVINVSPYDSILKTSDSFSLRIARNIQLLMKHESYIDKVVDPAAGSYYLESLTDSITKKAWEIFCEIESIGGFLEGIQKGIIQKKVADSRKKKEENLANRKEILLGTNQYPNGEDRVPELNQNKTLGEIDSVSGEITCERISDFRAGTDIEEIRLKTETFAKKSGKTPTVLLLPMGDLKMKKARAIFSQNFLACAGYKVVDPGSYATPQEVLQGLKETIADVVVFCTSDEEVFGFVDSVFGILKKQNPNLLGIVAGNPTEQIDNLKSKGIEFFIHVKSQHLETLKSIQKRLGIQ
ncbi:methylmalonyl-CoA mutase subunit beta [Leptospira interrogans]|uniref:methylmalonyl-CoA mutase family protein n=1 Tax=Leptospira interrogans TaxID=173 RepID=UPI0010C06392|nr:methylmalonyl-CoA mutase family protein [Leptospira interrogans]KAA1264052.1 methylmalonyl-CoA mutase [Leptospira interrogans serovar Weerasinghe]KAA1293673.1 methylmalonyl-CoA mutase [Leptospira interrogans serovar Geyaweera]QCO39297.1 methylmalonyl-CoA mutase [Leptospira interrogans]QCO43133.1 methylmalonyl-CoA mutase [Leptospira interrogans]ULG82403.1 methylmalonyl-CoA mutase subunit beta [Leptospira interrogans]